MKPRSVVPFLTAGLLAIPLLFTMSDVAGEQRGPAQHAKKNDVYIGLTEDFYRALQSESEYGNKVYGDRKSDEYLRQIAVSTRFMVETNLRILEMQGKILELLEKGESAGQR